MIRNKGSDMKGFEFLAHCILLGTNGVQPVKFGKNKTGEEAHS